MTLKQLSHERYNKLSEEDKTKLRNYAKTKVKPYLINSESAIMFEVYKFIRSKICHTK